MTKKHVLVVEDEPDVLAVICDCLSDCGYDALKATDGEDALKILSASDLLPGLIITDIVMPRKNGLDMIAEIRQRWPAIRILAISGGGREKTQDLLTKALSLGCHATMQKPLDMPELERTIVRLMGGKA